MMEKGELFKILANDDVNIHVNTPEDFSTILDSLKDVDSVKLFTESNLRVHYAKAGDAVPVLSGDNAELHKQNIMNKGGYYLSNGMEYYKINPAALGMLAVRARTSCDLFYAFIKEDKHEDICDLINYGFENAEKNAASTLYFRAGQIIGAFSPNYQAREQQTIYNIVESVLTSRFPDTSFIEAAYSHNLTVAKYSLGDCKSDLLKAYRLAWKKAGFSEDALEKCQPVVFVSTSDAGQCSVSVGGYLQEKSNFRLISEKQSERHYGKIYDQSTLEKKLDVVFGKMKQNADRLAELMTITLDYPMETMVRAMSIPVYGKKSLKAMSKKACKKVLEVFDLTIDPSSTTAFDVYSALCDLEYYSSNSENEIKGMSLGIVDALYKTINFDWKSLDKPGERELF